MNNSLEKMNYKFGDESLLEMALTHSSYARENKEAKCNERLEFLGDAFFDAIIGEKLYLVFPEKEEGELSRIRATLVCEKSLAIIARSLNIGQMLRLGHGEEKNGGRSRESILADAMESIIGAIYLDGGYEEAKRVVLELFGPAIEDAKVGKYIITDYKTRLQEILQHDGITNIKYEVIGESGPDHHKTFVVGLKVDGQIVAEGKGKSKKQAEQKAAESAINRRNNAI